MAEQDVAVTARESAWLRVHGYSTEPYDLCWLDCPDLGFLKIYRGRAICLCTSHAEVLESGKSGGSYRSAPLPPVTTAAVWPWQLASPVPVPTV